MSLKGYRHHFIMVLSLVVSSMLLYFLYNERTAARTRIIPRPRSAFQNSVEDSPHYLIHTPGCTIPDIPPDHPSIIDYTSKDPRVLKCSNHRPITEDSGLSLYYHQERLVEYGLTENSSQCYYEAVIRITQQPGKYDRNCDKKYELKKRVIINETRTGINDDGIIVTCVDLSHDSKAFYQNIHFFLQPRRSMKKRKDFKAKYGKRKPDQLSVIVLGTDAVSRGNLQRHMPKTFDYLTNHLHSIDLGAFNKVGDNTDPNVGAYLMGLEYGSLDKCKKNSRIGYDDCPFIWRDFAAKGYATAYAEDAPWMGMFHFNREGFCQEPTDFYNRPYFMASDKIIGHSAKNKGYNGNLCQGARSSMSIIHEYSLKVAEELKDIPYFGIYWIASITHDYLQSATMADDFSLDYLKKLNDSGYLNHTILFFLSDHGLRWGSFRSTYAGMLEERMPYVTITFPKWFKEKYPEAMKNLNINRRRLTASYDIYSTLKDILNQAYSDPITKSTVMPIGGRGLFSEIPRNRTCSSAGIPEHYCACEHTTKIDSNDTHLLDAAKEAIKEINMALQNFPDCLQLHLNKVLNGRKGSATNSTKPKKVDTISNTYVVTFSTNPGGAVMEATLKNHDGKYHLTADVSRVNKYGNQSHCINDSILRKYCYCKDMLS